MFISCNKPTSLVGMVVVEAAVGRGVWDISVPYARLCCRPKTALKTVH